MTRKEALDNVMAAAFTFYNCDLDSKDTEGIKELEKSFKIMDRLGQRLTRKK